MFTRRQILKSGTAAASLVCAPALIGRAATEKRKWSAGHPFRLGVSSGSPRTDGFVLWTQLAPDPLSLDPATPGGMSGGSVTVDYEIATDPRMRNVIRRGSSVAEAQFAFSVHAEIPGLRPGRPYWYRFLCGDAVSRIGRAVTLATPQTHVARLRIGVASCCHYEFGYFSAYRHLSAENTDIVLFLGDYIYEDGPATSPTVRKYLEQAEAASLASYRLRYVQHQLEPELQDLHARSTVLVTWDDHDVQEDYTNRWSYQDIDPAQFLKRRADAYQACYEHMPWRPSTSHPAGPDMRIYDRFRFGDLVDLSVLDCRQYRSKSPCLKPPYTGGRQIEEGACPELADPAQTMLGAEQEGWLFNGLSSSKAKWNVMASSILMAGFHRKQENGKYAHRADSWDGYPLSRARLLKHLDQQRPQNPLVLSGDLHSFWASDLKLDFARDNSPVVATEFLTTSITANAPSYGYFEDQRPQNPHVHFLESRMRGYSTIDFQADRTTARFQAVRDVRDPNTDVYTLKTFAVENGTPGIVES